MISALILAAGESKRMGQPKMLLAWGSATVLERVIGVVRSAGIEDVEVVTGAARVEIEAVCGGQSARATFNPAYASDEMLGSLQAGLRAMPAESDAALITLGDQPQIEASTVQRIVSEYGKSKEPLIVPSYQRRRGHPWILGRTLWPEILEMRAPDSPREFLNRHASGIHYVEIDSASILQDLDTPEDYRKARP